VDQRLRASTAEREPYPRLSHERFWLGRGGFDEFADE